jgi:serine/threonine protein kinase
MSSSTLPTTFGRYTLLRRLAAGGMAEVYLAKAAGQAGFEKLVAIKRVHPRAAPAEDSASSLIEEAKLSVALAHPNIVQTFDLGRVDGVDFIVMEHVEGYDAQYVLDALCQQGGRFPVDLAAHVITEVCRGLDSAHHHRDAKGEPAGIVHRDVSPQNILLSFAGEVKIADFGIAKTKGRRSDPEARIIKGKYFYMSPEQAWAEPLDHRSDVFSAGVVLWELLAGRRLHQEPDVRSLLDAVRRADVPAPSSVRAGVPFELDAIVACATAVSPSARYADAGAMADALEDYLATRPPVHAWRQIGSLLADLPPPAVESAPPPAIEVPHTRDRVATACAPERPTPTGPPLRYGLEDGEPTLVGRESPESREGAHTWLWTLGAGIALVGLVAWILYGA